MSVPLVARAPAKVNLTLRVLGSRPDGYHELESLVVFADCGDRLTFTPGSALSLTLSGATASEAGADAENLVLKAARALAARMPDLILGAFHLEKNLPVAAGLGGGSSDAAAALRLIAQANRLALDNPHLQAAARATGADVSVCLDPRPRLMRGIGEQLSQPLALPQLPAVLVNPGVALATKDVFAGLKASAQMAAPFDLVAAIAKLESRDQLLHMLQTQPNDLEAPAIILQPVIADVLTVLRGLAGCQLARMSGSGATCFGLFASAAGADAAAKILRAKYPNWWAQACTLGSGV
ncbi:MAG TPA: 4-(cytidine 5'-diphospho)-2-C-methyl-D-erythritol kinase [Xanthobacteraceae bacterium]|nr:4-(cytidine 5'-diphospho)-2-C-methyl-D-erythritol kinase [Xanthobacteraceae bacterium]